MLFWLEYKIIKYLDWKCLNLKNMLNKTNNSIELSLLNILQQGS